MKRTKLRLACVLVLSFLGATQAFAELEPGIKVTDSVISIGDGIYHVKRSARVNIRKPNEYYVYTDYLQISAWDGKVLSRCRNEMKRASDPENNGEWKTDILSHDPSCVFEKEAVETLEPLGEWRVENGAMKMGRRHLATEEFLRERMSNMIEGERNVCEKSENQGILAGCNLASDDKLLVLDGKPVANDKHVLIPVRTGETGKRDDESALLWVSIGRQYWKP